MLLNDGYTKGWTAITSLHPAFILLYGTDRLYVQHEQSPYMQQCAAQEKSKCIVNGNSGQCCILNGHVSVCCSLGVDVA